ncbi:WD40 repeat-like protein [Rhizopogon salebrosus TDB-379]|nr:WD40 repeat-like protein [Rhizopogon salebrosus TDB-379]
MDVDLPCKLELLSDLSAHDERAWQVAWNPTKPLLASCSADKTVRLYSYRASDHGGNTVAFSHVGTIPTGHTKTVRSIAWTPSGKTFATGSFDSNVGIWEPDDASDSGDTGEKVADWECVTLLEGHETECKSVGYSSSGTLLASCSRDKTVWIWEVKPDADFECMGVLMEHSQDVKCIAWHPSEEILASASYDDTIKLYIDDPSEDWYCFSTLSGHKSTVWSLAWSPQGSYLASSSDDLTIRIWKRVEEHTWQSVIELKGHQRSIYSISWGVGKRTSESLGWLATTGGDGKINVWDITESPSPKNPLAARLLASISGAHDTSDINSVSWCPRSDHADLFASAGDDGSVKVWRVVSS